MFVFIWVFWFLWIIFCLYFLMMFQYFFIRKFLVMGLLLGWLMLGQNEFFLIQIFIFFLCLIKINGYSLYVSGLWLQILYFFVFGLRKMYVLVMGFFFIVYFRNLFFLQKSFLQFMNFQVLQFNFLIFFMFLFLSGILSFLQ